MSKSEWQTLEATGEKQRNALASPLRLEIIGLFTGGEPLAISDMARLMGRTAGSLYYHVGLLEDAGLLRQTGTRPRGKRYEALYFPTATRFELEAGRDEDQSAFALKTMATAFRMAKSDLAAALQREDVVTEGAARDILAYRMHLRARPELLAGINEHLDAIEELMQAEMALNPEPSPDDKHMSLTLALLPLKGRGQDRNKEGESNE